MTLRSMPPQVVTMVQLLSPCVVILLSQPGAKLSPSRQRTSSHSAFKQAAGDGSYELELRAEIGDEIVMWYELDGEGSEALNFTLKAP